MTVRQRLRLVSLAIAAAPAAMLGFAYYTEYVVGLLPCMLCLYQRPPHYVAAIAGLLAFALVGGPRLASRALLGLAGTALLLGAIIGFFHAGVELKLWLGPAECGGKLAPLVTDLNDLSQAMKDTKVVQCDEPSWVFLGLSMAAWNGILSLGLALFAFWGMLQGQLKGRYRT
ncbi:MAG: disulfide bond formation protein B [Alphaproteobacteria bacterium]|nr:disulfide bond formation protein B [Alphaproteobacteria bacterium]